MIGLAIVLLTIFVALRVQESQRRLHTPVAPPRATMQDVERWMAAKRAEITTEPERRAMRVFEWQSVGAQTLATAQLLHQSVIPALEAQWRFEHLLQVSLVQRLALREVAAQLDIEDIPFRAASIRAAVTQLVAESEPVVERTGPVHETPIAALSFKPHEPTRLADVTTQPALVERLSILVRAMRPPQAVPNRHLLLTGPAGLGKTLLAKILAHEVRRYNAAESQPLPRWFELYGSNLVTIEDYDAVFREVHAASTPCVILLDEIHCLDERMATKLYKLLEDGEYAFHGDVNPTRMPPVMLIGATTDYGELHAALKRRLGEPMAMETLSPEALFDVVVRRPFPITHAAAHDLVRYTKWGGAPWEALSLAFEAEQVARAEDMTTIGAHHVATVVRMLRLDDYGLRPADRAVLEALHASPRYRGKTQELVCYALSQADCCLRARLDPGEFAAVTKPRLQSRGFLVTRSGYGQALTDAAIAAYFTPT